MVVGGKEKMGWMVPWEMRVPEARE